MQILILPTKNMLMLKWLIPKNNSKCVFKGNKWSKEKNIILIIYEYSSGSGLNSK